MTRSLTGDETLDLPHSMPARGYRGGGSKTLKSHFFSRSYWSPVNLVIASVFQIKRFSIVVIIIHVYVNLSILLDGNLLPVLILCYCFIVCKRLFCIVWSYSIIHILYCIVSYRIVSYRIISYHIVSYHIISYRIVSYRVLYCISNINYKFHSNTVSTLVYFAKQTFTGHTCI